MESSSPLPGGSSSSGFADGVTESRVGRPSNTAEVPPPAGFWHLARTRPALWLIPAASVWLATAAYLAVRPTEWEAVQTVSVRPQETPSEGESRWLDGDQRKSLQETLLELFRSRAVLEAALLETDRPGEAATKDGAKKDVDPRRIERLRRVIKVTPPQGADLGSSDMLCLRVRDTDRTRAARLAEALCRQADLKWRALRRERAAAAAAEWERAVQTAEGELRRVNERLAAMETDLGARLPELRAWANGPGGDTPLMRRLSDYNTELRMTESELRDTEGLLRDVRAAVKDSSRLLDAANALIKREPSIEHWKTAWVEAQVRLADARGRMTDQHPEVVAAAAAEREIHGRLVEEISALVSILEGEQDDLRAKRDLLQARIAGVNEEIRELAAKRVAYTNLVSEREQRLAVLQNARQRKDHARLTADAVTSTQLLIPMEGPETGLDPVGPGRAVILLGGLIAGLAFGFGVLAWCVPAPGAAVSATPPSAPGEHTVSSVMERQFLPVTAEAEEAGTIGSGIVQSSSGEAPPETSVVTESPVAEEVPVLRQAVLSMWTDADGPLPSGRGEGAVSFSGALLSAAAEQSATG